MINILSATYGYRFCCIMKYRYSESAGSNVVLYTAIVGDGDSY